MDKIVQNLNKRKDSIKVWIVDEKKELYILIKSLLLNYLELRKNCFEMFR